MITILRTILSPACLGLWHTIPMGAGKRFSACVAEGDDPSAAILAALSFAEGFAAEQGLPDSTAARLAVVVEELVSNAVRHGARGGSIDVGLKLERVPGGVGLTIEDSGIAFDPTIARDFSGPDADTGGGVGLALIRAWCSALDYAREGGRNRLALVLPDR